MDTSPRDRGDITRQHRLDIFSGGIALASSVALGTAVTAGAAPKYGTYTGADASTATTAKPTSDISRAGSLATLHTATNTVRGKTESILVNAKGLPLYYFQGDSAKKSNVRGALLRLWPALISRHPVGTGTPGKLAALQAANGHQVTYNGRFLYTFIDDTPGHVNGQGVSGFFVATPQVKPITGSTAIARPTSGSVSHGYGY
jgi:predicted lipoprotein with Yx(FWY)xxD motif